MPDAGLCLVIDTSPVIALVAALGDLRVLQLYRRVVVPYEVQLRAHGQGYGFRMSEAIARMRTHGIWLSERVVRFALAQSGEDADGVPA